MRSGRGSGGNPQATWTVNGKDCAKFVDILDAFPLRSKKQRDYEIWKQVVALYMQFKRGGAGARSHNQPLIDQIQQLAAELKEVRVYADPQ